MTQEQAPASKQNLVLALAAVILAAIVVFLIWRRGGGPTPPRIDAAPGDANADGRLDKQDLDSVLSYVNQNGPPPAGNGDANGDGKIDARDAFFLTNALYAARPTPTAAAPSEGPTPTAAALATDKTPEPKRP